MEDKLNSFPKKEEKESSLKHLYTDFPYHKKIHTLDSWRVFRIISEIVEGFETMTSLGPSVAVFGSSTETPSDFTYYNLAIEIAKKTCG